MSGDAHPEIVIIRRGGHGDHDEHHGGVWKIAFADFMTAMMAFFLVMWLISANDKTRASVARYFNPVRLVDATTQPRGLHESKKDESGITASPDSDKKDEAAKANGEVKQKAEEKKAEENKKEAKGKAEEQAAAAKETPAGRDKRLDAELQVNPYAALSEIAADKGPGALAAQAAPKPREPNVGLKGGAHFRDPFAPPSPVAAASQTVTPPSAVPEKPAPQVAPAAQQVAALRGKAFDPDPGAKEDTKDEAPTEQKPITKAAREKTEAAAEKQAAELERAIKASAKAVGKETGPAVAVKRTKEGLLLSLTDTNDFAMFSSGSAVPSRKVVVMMEKVGALLKSRPGTIVLRGFTDNKPFKSGRYDNWRLSLDRAQVAHYMLVRGGLADARIAHIEGFADRGGKPGVEPDSPLNRRIEILVKDEPA